LIVNHKEDFRRLNSTYDAIFIDDANVSYCVISNASPCLQHLLVLPLQGGTLSMAEIMERMAEQKQNAVQAAERTLCDRLNSLAAALTAAADAADVARGGRGGKSGSAATPASPVEAVDGSGAGGAGRRGRKRKAAEGGRNLPIGQCKSFVTREKMHNSLPTATIAVRDPEACKSEPHFGY